MRGCQQKAPPICTTISSTKSRIISIDLKFWKKLAPPNLHETRMPLVISAAVFNFYGIRVKQVRRAGFVLKVSGRYSFPIRNWRKSTRKLCGIFQQFPAGGVWERVSLICAELLGHLHSNGQWKSCSKEWILLNLRAVQVSDWTED